MIRYRFVASIALLLSTVAPAVRADSINVAAAISMKESLIEAGAAFQKETGDDVTFSFGASGALLTDIRNGAPVDAFISAGVEQIDALEKEKKVVAGSRRTIAANELVMIVPANSTLQLTSLDDLKDPKVKQIAIGQPKVVPAGMYAMQVLKSMKIDAAVANKLIFGTNVRQVLEYVEHGEVEAGLVYATDAQQVGARVHVIATAPAESHEPIVYPAVLLADSTKREAAKKFLDFLASKKGAKILRNHGFDTDAATTQPTK